MGRPKIKPSKKKTVVSYSLEKRLIEDVEEAAIDRNISASLLVSSVLSEYLK